MSAIVTCPTTLCGAPVAKVVGKVNPRGGHTYTALPCAHVVEQDVARAAADAGRPVWLEAITGSALITAERARQHTEEGYRGEHDAQHASDLAWAAWCYIDVVAGNAESGAPLDGPPPKFWPWDAESWKPGPTPLRMLVKAGALIAAEIDRRLARGETP